MPASGLFITGTDTGVGKTYVTALIARELAKCGHHVGVYKPAASGCRRVGDQLVSDDAVMLWEAAGRPGKLERVCPQRFAAPLAPHLAARDEGRELNSQMMRDGLHYWLERANFVLVEGAGGLMSPLGPNEYVADLAQDFGFPLIIVSRNVLGTINQTLQTLIAARARLKPLPVSGVVLNNVMPSQSSDDRSLASNRRELEARLDVPLLAEVAWQGGFNTEVDWVELGRQERL